MLRRMIEDVTRDWVIRRRLPADFLRASIHVTPSAGLRYLYRSMDDVDPVLLSLVKEFVKPGAVVWDVGANVGLFSFAAASLAGPEGHIVAFEPDAWLTQLLRRSASVSRLARRPCRSFRRQSRQRCRSARCVLPTGPEPPIIWPSSGPIRPEARGKSSRSSR